jgi:predicted permease
LDVLPAIQTNFLAIAQIFILGCFGFYVLRRGILGECCLRTLSDLTLDVTLPCFVFTSILDNFESIRGEAWFLYPLYCAGLFALCADRSQFSRAARNGGAGDISKLGFSSHHHYRHAAAG